MSDAPTLYSIPPGAPFLDDLARGLLAMAEGDPGRLSAMTVLLPTRRACRALAEAFLRRSAGRAMLLPTLRPLGDGDEDELLVEAFEDPLALDLPPAPSPARRQLLLAELVRGSGVMGRLDAARALGLAGDLARLLDLLAREDRSLEDLRDLVPDEFADHWRQTLAFLQILDAPWRGLLDAEGAMEGVARRNAMIRRRAEAWRRAPPDAPVIAAGSTGSIPATAELLDVVARLPKGAVVLPGLDAELDPESWAALGEGHHQGGLKQLLARLEVDRDAVRPWPWSLAPTAAAGHRAHLLREAMRPAETSQAWRALPALPAEAVDGFERHVCLSSREEAEIIALRLRETLERPGATAALVTPDRELARRVVVLLRRWGVEIDDSAGLPLARTPVGVFLRLVAEAMAAAFAPVPLLALMKHPLFRAGMTPARARARARGLELRALRGSRPAAGLRGLRDLLRDDDGATRALHPLLDRLEAAAAPYQALVQAGQARFEDLAEAHFAAAEALSRDENARPLLWDGRAGEAAGDLAYEIGEAAPGLRPVEAAGHPAMFAELMAGRVVRPTHGRHPRLHIWGPLEARLQAVDMLVLSGLNEGVWPAEAEVDPWLSRPMRARAGLPSPERRIGLAAHDFVQAASAPHVVLTRAQKVEGTETVPSRWLTRLDVVAAGAGLTAWGAPIPGWEAWREDLSAPTRYAPTPPPAPRPPLAARPRSLSATQIETWMRDPYAIYARHILGLRALDEIDADAGAADRGSAIHAALEAFTRDYPDDVPDDALARLLEHGRTAFGDLLRRPGIRAFWWPRFERVAEWFIAHERGHRAEARPLGNEAEGRLVLPGPGGDFTLVARADRIDRASDGGLIVIDYKTGQPPGEREVAQGFAPQLPLEAAIARAGGFDGVPAGRVDGLAYWQLGGGQPAGRVRTLKLDAEDAAEAARAGLAGLVVAFDDPETPYRARPRPRAAPRFSDYGHLARLAEWGGVAEGGE